MMMYLSRGRLSTAYLLAAALGVMLVGTASAGPRDVKLIGVVAVEPADSAIGKTRLVFTTAAPLPPPTSMLPGPTFWIGDEPVRLAPFAPEGTLHFGYTDADLRGTVRLRVVEVGGTSTTPGGERSSLEFDADALRARARPAAGDYEAAHVRRSADVADLRAAWEAAGAVHIARFVRRETATLGSGWRLHFDVSRSLRGAATKGELLTVDVPTVGAEMEVGARYAVFAPRAPGTGPTFVRLWWAESDPVELWLDRAATNKPADAPTLLADLRSPTAEVRLTSARELRQAALTAEQRAQVAARESTEPVEIVRGALRALRK